MPEYVYEDDQGDPAYRVVRYNGKNFRQEHPNGAGWASGRGDGAFYPYHLTEVLAAIDAGEPVYICEGEKDVETARLQGVTATCNSGGAGKWRPSDSQWLRAVEPARIVWDRDVEGRKHALQVEQMLQEVGISDIIFLRARVGKDLTDHIEAGFTIDELVQRKPKPVPAKEQKTEEERSEEKFLPAAFQLALERLERKTREGDPDDNQWNARCPAHDDSNPSLSIKPGTDVAVMVTCHANGCTPQAIAEALGMNPIEFTVMPEKLMGAQEQEDARQYRRMKAIKNAERKIKSEHSNSVVKISNSIHTVDDELDRPSVEVDWLADSWFKSDTAVLLNADPKIGKTCLALHLVQALVDELPFLGRYQTTFPYDATVWYGNWDMPEDLFKEYLEDYDWMHPERVLVNNLMGAEFPFWEDDIRDDFVAVAKDRNIQLMVVDTLHVAGQGYITDSNNNDEVSQFIHLLRAVCKLAEIANLLIIHHTGHGDKTRGRGASTLAADVDGLWTYLWQSQDDKSSPRFLSAFGRKLGQAQIEVVQDMGTGLYKTTGKGPDDVRQAARVDRAELNDLTALFEFHSANGRWPSRSTFRANLMKGRNSEKEAHIKDYLNRGLIAITEVKSNGLGGRPPALVELTDEGKRVAGL